MSEQQTPASTPAAGEGEGQEPTTTNTPDPTAQAAGGEGEGTTSTDDGTKPATDPQVKELRGENAATRRKLRDTEAELETLKRERMTEQERAQADAAKATEAASTVTTKAQNALGKAALTAAAIEAKFIDPSIAADLLRDSLEFDDDFEPINVAALVKKLAEQRPSLVNHGGPGAGGAPGAAAPGGQPKKAESREDFLGRFGMLR